MLAFPPGLARTLLLALLLAAPAARAAGPLVDTIVPDGTSVALEDFVLIPASDVVRPLARLNLLGHAGDGSGRLFVNDMRGKIYGITGGVPEVFLDVGAALGGALVTSGLQLGVSTFAFHPDYAVMGAAGEGRFYTVTSQTSASGTADFAHPGPGSGNDSVLTEWTVDPTDADRIDPGSAREILRIALTSPDHLMSQIGFDPNAAPGSPDRGLLYIAVGDGAGYFAQLGDEIDPFRVAQDRTNPFGSVLRIDPLGASTPERPTNGAYGIPASNPFALTADGTLKEIFAYGFRNPHRFSWDTGGTGKMLLSDIGQANIEEVNLVEPGANYGWSEREGTFAVDPLDQEAALPLPADDASFGYTYPVVQYDHDDGFAIIGGFVYRGTLLPELVGRYVFGDNNGRIFHVPVTELVDGSQAMADELTLVFEGAPQTLLEILGEARRADLRFGAGEDGELFALTKRDGMIRRLPEPTAGAAAAAACATLVWLRRRSRGAGRGGRGQPWPSSFTLSSSVSMSLSKPSRFNTAEYSDRRSASSLTVPFK